MSFEDEMRKIQNRGGSFRFKEICSSCKGTGIIPGSGEHDTTDEGCYHCGGRTDWKPRNFLGYGGGDVIRKGRGYNTVEYKASPCSTCGKYHQGQYLKNDRDFLTGRINPNINAGICRGEGTNIMSREID